MKTYQLQSDDDNGLLRVSLVKEPAIEAKLMAFNEDKETLLKFVNDEKREIFAPALIPNKLMFRKSINGEPAKVFLDAETIKELHLKGAKQNYDSKINLNHEEMNTEGVYCFESWIVEDSKVDKAFKLGFEVPNGTLMKGYKIDNDKTWEKIKTGEITGLSIEAYLTPSNDDIINFKKEVMNKKNVWEHIKSLFSKDDAKEFASGYFGQSLEEGSIITDEDGNVKANGGFEFDGNKYTTDDMGAISSVEAIEVEDPAADETENKIAVLEAENNELKAQLEKAKQSEEDKVLMSKEVENLKAELLEFKRIPAIPAVEPIPYEKMSNAQKVKYNRGL